MFTQRLQTKNMETNEYGAGGHIENDIFIDLNHLNKLFLDNLYITEKVKFNPF